MSYYESESESDYETDYDRKCISWNGGGSEYECICESCNICKGPINSWTVSYANISAYDIT